LKAALKSFAKWMIEVVAVLSGMTTVGRRLHAQIVAKAILRTRHVVHGGVSLEFATPNLLNDYRASTFSTKEPETLAWIDSLTSGAVLWDIGANVGLYSCYAAKHRGCTVFAFEPSVFNVELLARNILLNKLVDKIAIFSLPITQEMEIANMNFTTTEWGGALSTFGHDYGHDGRVMNKAFEFRTMGLSMDDVVNLLHVPQPDFVKIDVDGIEHLILAGGKQTLRRVQGILIELNDDFHEQSVTATTHLKEAGFVLEKKLHSEIVEKSNFRSAFNQIWCRPA
jgi:FkbM family methyltransferase